MRISRALALAAAALVFGAVSASPGSGLTLTPDPAVFTNGPLQGTVSVVAITTGTPAGAVIGPGSAFPGPANVTLVVQLTNTGTEPIAGAGILAPGAGPIGPTQVGWIPGASEPDGLRDVSAAYSLFASFSFPGGANALLPGETSNPFFVSYVSLPIGTVIRFGGNSPGLTYQSFIDTVVVVPEPATALLLGGALAGLAGAARLRRSA